MKPSGMPQTATACLEARDAAEISRLLEPYLERLGAHLVLFGSRARGDCHAGSDIDLAIREDQSIPAWVMAEMRERLEDSRIPFRVDLVDWSRATPSLKESIEREGIPWPI